MKVFVAIFFASLVLIKTEKVLTYMKLSKFGEKWGKWVVIFASFFRPNWLVGVINFKIETRNKIKA
jgi:hypothetical protein